VTRDNGRREESEIPVKKTTVTLPLEKTIIRIKVETK